MTVVHLNNPVPDSSYARHFLTTEEATNSANNPSTGESDSKHREQPSNESTMDTQGITLSQLDSYKDNFDADIKNKLATLTISRESYSNVLEN
ncbi:hypothetical protein FB639_004953 [Coemansia asiatica]|nr:hypothetical protein FB639_004953 [Coemansia asiatica]